ncbi:hypothetical protein P692DRAFT_20746183 [Suillus brevipes Sb2]|nr:hypothetical protein P692DRAFT_20746183 [Suillus brevipes Sb2]
MRRLTTNQPRKPWCQHTRTWYKLSAADKAVLKDKWLTHRVSYAQALQEARNVVNKQAKLLHKRFGKHSVEYYFGELMQRARAAQSSRSPTRWNAFVRKEVKHINAEHPSGSPSVKASQCVKELASRWNNMTKAAEEEETNDAVQSLEEFREMKNLALHNVPLNAFQDVRKTLETLDREARSLNARTGVEVLIIATRSNLDHFNQPHLFHTQRAADFLDACYGTSAMDVALRMEAFCIAGVQGVVKTHLQEVLALKKAISALILQKHPEAAPFKVPRMYYQNFDSYITAKLHIILENWPLSKFCTPGDISSQSELTVLHNTWESGATHFRKLTETKLKDWEDQRFEEALNSCTGDRDKAGLPNSNDNTSNSDNGISNSDNGTSNDNDTSNSDNGTFNGVPSGGITPPTTSTSATPPETQAQFHLGSKRKARTTGVSTVTMTNGNGIAVEKRACKEQSDKGQKRGPHKKPHTNDSGSATSANDSGSTTSACQFCTPDKC